MYLKTRFSEIVFYELLVGGQTSDPRQGESWGEGSREDSLTSSRAGPGSGIRRLGGSSFFKGR